VGIWVIVCIKKPSHHILQTFRPLQMFKIVFRDSLAYFIWNSGLILSAMADQRLRWSHWLQTCYTNFCIMIKLLHELKNRSY